MIELYKKRNLSDYFNDTIAFFKATGKHFFKNYFIVNGPFLLLLSFLMYVIMKVYVETLFGLMINPAASQPAVIINLFYDNAVLYISVLLVFVLLTLFLSLMSLTYPVIYVQLMERHGGNDFTTAAIIAELRLNLGRMFVFLAGLVFIIVPVLMILFTLLFFLTFILIGIPMLVVALPAAMSWIALSYHDYVIRRCGFFEALGQGFRMLRQKFWTIVGTTFLMMLMLQILQGILTMVPYVIGIILLFTSAQAVDFSDPDFIPVVAVYMAALMVFAVIVSYFFNNFLILCQGLMYYSSREDNEHKATQHQIETIGTAL